MDSIQANEASDIADNHYRGLFAAMQEALLVAELIERPGEPIDFRYIDLNPAAERMLGVSREQIVGRTARAIIPNIQEELVDLSLRVVRTGVAERREVFEPLFQQFHQSVYFRPAPGQIAVVFTDVTERRRTEQALTDAAAALAEQRERLEVLVSSIDDHLASYDREWRFTFVNAAAARVLGRSREELLGRSIWELFPGAIGNQYYRDLHTAVRENRPLRSEHYYPPFGQWFDNHIYPSPAGVTVFATDITARKKAEAALRESEERFRVMADALELIVWVHRADGSHEFVNARFQEFFGVTLDGIRDMPWRELIHPDDHSGYVGAFESALANRTAFHSVGRVRRADGEWRWVESWGRPRFSGNGEFTGLVGASSDVTERLAADQALRDADQRKDEFLATLAHELRNPLAAIRSSLAVLRADAPEARPAATAFSIVDRQVAHMIRQVDDLLDVSRITRAAIDLRAERTDLNQIVRQAIDASEAAPDRIGHVLDVTMPATAVFVDGDPTRLSQIVANLLSNAFKFSDPRTEVRITLQAEDGFAVLRVRDHGIGVPPTELERIFGMFTQLDTSLERSKSGLGIGLGLVKALVQRHGGTIVARSDGPGTGSEFIVRLPLSAGHAQAVNSAAPDVAPVTSRRILVVDDNHDSADALGLILELSGHTVCIVYDGMAAIDTARTFAPDVVLLDVGMPGLNGYETARRLREQYGTIRLVAVTGWGEDTDRRRSHEAGFDLHLVKPVDPERLNALLSQ